MIKIIKILDLSDILILKISLNLYKDKNYFQKYSHDSYLIIMKYIIFFLKKLFDLF